MDDEVHMPTQGPWPFVGIIAVLTGVALWFGTVGPLLDRVDEQSWPLERCTITSSTSRWVTVGPNATSRHVVDLRASYVIGGATHEQPSRIQPSFPSSTEADALAARYPVGVEIGCHVSPADPTQMAVAPEIGAGPFVVAIPILILGIGMSFAVVQGLRRRRRAFEQDLD